MADNGDDNGNDNDDDNVGNGAMDLNHSMAFKSAAANCRLQDYLQMPTPMLPQIPQPTYEAAQEGMQQAKLNQLQNQLKLFWAERKQEIREMTDYKQHHLPLARIKKVMKSDEHVKMISADAPLVFSKACELFILELTFRAWMQTEEGNRRTLQRADIANAICKSRSLDFLLDVVPRERHDEDDQTTGRRVHGQRIPPQPNGFKALNGPNGFSVPSSFNVPNGPNSFNGPPFSVIGPNLFQQNHNVGEDASSQMLDMNRGRIMPLLTNNGVQFPMMPTNQYQMNRNPVAEEGFYGGNMGGGVANGMYHPPRMNSADQFHQKFYADNQAGSSHFPMIGRSEAEFQAGQLNGMHFSVVGRHRADFQAGTSNGMQFGTLGRSETEFQSVPSNGAQFGMFGRNEAEFQAGTSNSGMFGRNESQIQSGLSNFSMFGRSEAQLQSGPLNFGVFGRNEAQVQTGPSSFGIRNEAQLQTGPSNFGIRNEAQLQSGNGKRSRLL